MALQGRQLADQHCLWLSVTSRPRDGRYTLAAPALRARPHPGELRLPLARGSLLRGLCAQCLELLSESVTLLLGASTSLGLARALLLGADTRPDCLHAHNHAPPRLSIVE